MPTATQYLLSSDGFNATADRLEQLAGATARLEPRDAVRGGLLGARTQETTIATGLKLVRAAALARSAAVTCAARASRIQAYEAALANYEVALLAYETQLDVFSCDDCEGEPAYVPPAPKPPAPLPEWAEPV